MPRLAYALSPLLLLLTAGCTELGERAANGTCPDEPCSDATPEGLEFGGPPLGDSLVGNRNVKVTAVGGVQHVELIDHATGRALFSSYQAFTVDDVLEVTGRLRNVVTLTGRAPGSTSLRIEVDDGLLDRLTVEADAIAEVELRPNPLRARRADPALPWLAWAGAEASLLVELRADDGTRLIDEDLVVAASDGAAIDEVSWDVRQLTVPATGLAVSVRAGDLIEPLPYTVAATDQLDAARARLVIDGPIEAGGLQAVCFEASQAGTEVVFVPWTFAASSGIELIPNLFGDNCVALSRPTPGSVDVTGTAPGGLAATVRVDFVEPTGARQLRSVEPPALGSSLGERATD